MNRSFYALVVSQTATNLAFALYTMTIVLHLKNETGSTALATIVTLISMVSHMLSSIYLPMISDKYKSTSILKFSQCMQLLILLGLYTLMNQKLSFTIFLLLFFLLAGMSFFNGFFSPLKSSIVRSVVVETERVKANSFISTIDQTFLFAGWTFGALMLALFGKEFTLFFTFFLTLLSMFSLLFIKGIKDTEVHIRESMIKKLTTGWKLLFQHKGTRVLVFMDIMESWVGTIWIGAVTLTFVQDALGKGDAWWGYINGGYYLGTIVGGLLVYRLSSSMKGRLTLFMLAGSMLFGLLTVIYGFTTNAYFALLLVVFMGPSYQIRDLAQETMYQNSADEKTLTKILAAKSTLIQFIFIFSIMGIGILTDIIGVQLVYIFSGFILLSSSLFGYIYLVLRKEGTKLEHENNKSNNY
ncbi:MFS transporter [Chengkuizengella axinellae]|uniref:MFS transporter n=1 Tax=Chengkuizengella axinellae TaxID=3064388 RepID=A0ABT9IWJ9_9BACL|nr:MFS transporter [Chengkuizengella sp. 2205SS18-9]MDP5273744.1 MFS transporter [Chengkuizengella sp. 2205SS18-9]